MPGLDNATILRTLAGVVIAFTPGLGWLIKRAIDNDTRMVKLETVVAELAEARKAQADILPRLEETMRNLTEVCRQLVPRPEWENVNRLHEQRMERIERERD